MSENKERMVECRKCGSELCYETIIDGTYATWSCLLCGFTTNIRMLDKTVELEAYLKGLPKLYQDLKHVDSDGFVWVPLYIKVEGRGEIYANKNPNQDYWFWTACKHIPIPEHEKEIYKNPDGSYRTYKADAANAEFFHNMKFAEALHYLGML